MPVKKKHDLRVIAQMVSKLEGGKRNLSIDDITEVLGCYQEVMFIMNDPIGVWGHEHMAVALENGRKRDVKRSKKNGKA